MMLSHLFSISLLSLALPCIVLADVHVHKHAHRHHEIAQRAEGHMQLHKRFSSARWTFYDVGLGACGKYNVASDFIVALNTPQFGGGFPGPNCFKSITMQYNGKTTTATVMDECPGCPWGGLDLSRGLFTFFAPESEGVLTGNWWFNDQGGGQPAPTTTTSKWTPPAVVTPTTTWSPPPTTTWVPTTNWVPTTTWVPPVVSTSSSSASSSSNSGSSHSSASSSSVASSSVSVNHSSGAASGLAIPSGTISSTPQTPQNLNAINDILIYLGAIVVQGAAP